MTAADDLTKAETVAAGWRTEYEAKAAELDRVRSMQDFDPDEDPAEASVRVAELVLRLSTAIDVAASAIVAADAQVDEARRALMLDRAGALRARATGLRAVAAERQQITDGLVAQLAEHECLTYVIPDRHLTRTLRMRNLADSLDKFAAEDEAFVRDWTPAQVATGYARQRPDFHELERRFVPGTPAEAEAEAVDDRELAAAAA